MISGTREITVNGSAVFRITQKQEQLLLNDREVDWSCELLADGSFSIIYQEKSYRAEVTAIIRETKTLQLRIGRKDYQLHISEPVDQVLKAMGLNGRQAKKDNQIKAPMPGMVLRVLVTPGQALAQGDPVLVLEAMKMENVFKAPGEVTVKEVRVRENSAVEKGQVLIIFE
jgi:biotin carboxyl carrier protein